MVVMRVKVGGVAATESFYLFRKSARLGLEVEGRNN